jgi:hypothetical protein
MLHPFLYTLHMLHLMFPLTSLQILHMLPFCYLTMAHVLVVELGLRSLRTQLLLMLIDLATLMSIALLMFTFD